jgi:hypothetical protein
VVSFLPTFDLPAVKINAEPLFKRLFPQNPLIEQKLTLAFQLTSQELKQDVPFKKIIETLFRTQILVIVQ